MAFRNVPPLTAGDVVCGDIFTALPATGTILPSADYHLAAPAPVEFNVPQRAQNLAITIVITAQSGAGNTLTVEVDAFDKASATWIPLLTSAGLVAAGTTVLRIGPAATPSANVAAQSPLFETLRLKTTEAGTVTTLNFSVGATFTA
jgi:hypothetical protein